MWISQVKHVLLNYKTKKRAWQNVEQFGTDLDEHELLHGLHPLQQHDTGLEGSTQVFMAGVRVTD